MRTFCLRLAGLVLILLAAIASVNGVRANPSQDAHPSEALAYAGATYSYRLEAYDYGTLVSTMSYSTFAADDARAAQLANNKLAVWGQQLRQSGISYNRLTAVLLSKTSEAAPESGWKGTATATCKCTDGTSKTIMCSVSGKASYEDAERSLRAEIEAKAETERGQIQGSISLSITKDL